MTLNSTHAMPLDEDLTAARVAIAGQYFHKVDAGDPTLFDLLADDIQIYFPKFGVGYGKGDVAETVKGLMKSLDSLEHDFERMTFIAAGNYVVVEGFEKGVTKDGVAWPDPNLSEGRFCNVFEFDGTLIKRLHIYVDPDFTSSHKERFLWGEPVRRTRT